MHNSIRLLAGLAVLALAVAAAAWAGNAATVPGGGKIAFERHLGTGAADIFVLNPDGRSLRRLTRTQNNFAPAWSPDGRRIAFASDRAGGSGASELYVMNADGTDVRRVTRSARTGGNWRSNYDVAWSPDGTKLVFVRLTVRGSRDVADLYLINVDGSGLRRLTATPRAPEEHPAWAPDGSLIAFARTGGIWTVRPDGTGARRIVAAGSQPAFSPDGTKLAFADASGRIAEIGVDGRFRRNIVRAHGSPAWSPDGTQIVYQGLNGLHVINADRTGRRRLTRPPQLRNDLSPAWQPAAQEAP